MEMILQQKQEEDDTLDDVVFLYRAKQGECTDSFGWHCAYSANLPDDVISRARHISLCKSQKQRLLPLDADVERLQR